MNAQIVEQVRAEKADLLRKLEACDAFLAVYDTVAATPKNVAKPAAGSSSSKRGKVSLDRFSAYGQQVVQRAMDVIRTSPVVPVPTRTLAERIESSGVEIRGEDKVNALSALLARSADVNSNGRRGWTLANVDQKIGREPEENEPPEGGSDGAEGGAATPPEAYQAHSNWGAAA